HVANSSHPSEPTMGKDGRYDLLFVSDRFNLSQPKDYFINDCCYGDDLARWLVERLLRRGVLASQPGQEDWGWYFEAPYQGANYFVGVGGNADDEHAPSNRGEWRLIVEKRRTLWEKLKKVNRLADDDTFIQLLKSIVVDELGTVASVE